MIIGLNIFFNPVVRNIIIDILYNIKADFWKIFFLNFQSGIWDYNFQNFFNLSFS